MRLESVVAIILTGGYGRGEGTWILEDGDYRPYNDYDFVVAHEGTTWSRSQKKTRKH